MNAEDLTALITQMNDALELISDDYAQENAANGFAQVLNSKHPRYPEQKYVEVWVEQALSFNFEKKAWRTLSDARLIESKQ